MSEFLSNFEDKKEDVDKYFNFVDFLENYTTEQGKKLEYSMKGKIIVLTMDDKQQKVLRANCYLMLYNLVEGSITEAIDAIFDAISTQNIHFQYLTHAYKKIWLAYKQGLVKITAESSNKPDPKNHAKNKVGKLLSEVLNHIEYFQIFTVRDKIGIIAENYRAYLKVVDATDISGNMDARKIREDLVKKYDFYQIPTEMSKISANVADFLMRLKTKYEYTEIANLSEWQKKCDELLKLECNDLVTVKNIRNQLAHGEVSFSEAADHSIEHLINIKKNIFMYLEFILLNINDFIENEGFKMPIEIK